MTNLKVLEVKDKELTLRKNIRTLLMDFKDETGMYVDSIYLNYFNTFSKMRHDLDVEFTTRLDV